MRRLPKNAPHDIFHIHVQLPRNVLLFYSDCCADTYYPVDDDRSARAGWHTRWCVDTDVVGWILDFFRAPYENRLVVIDGVRCANLWRSWSSRGHFPESPRSSVRGTWIASSSSGGASWTPLIAAVRYAVASRILSVAMMVGTGMACWQNWNVSVMRSPAVSAIKTQMQRYWLVEWERFQALDAWYPHVLHWSGFM